MTAIVRQVLTLLSIGLVATSSVSPSALSGQSLTALTVPVDRLPKGCRLEPVDPDVKGAFMDPGVRENPWTSTERRFAFVRIKVDGPAFPTYGLPDGPARYARLGEDVEEYYRARYIAADQQRIEVYAVRFKDPALTQVAAMAQLITDPPQRPRIVRGATAALVFKFSRRDPKFSTHAGEDCLLAVTQHISGIK